MGNKKGVVEIQFNWIFILAIGAIILLFFSVIIIRQKNISEVSTSSLILKNLEAILSGAEVSIGLTNSVKIPKTKIEFECNRYRVGKVSKQFEVMSIFTPSIIESNKLITWTLDWSLPYRVTNLLYLTSPEIRYVFVPGPGVTDCATDPAKTCFGKDVFNSAPEEIRKEIIDDVSGIRDEGDDHIRIIFFDETPTLPSDLIDTKKGTVSGLAVYTSGTDNGKLEFLYHDRNAPNFYIKDSSYYINEPTLFGAIFADNPEIYNCVMETAFKKLNIVSQVYKEKTNALWTHYDNLGTPFGDSCKNYHFDTHIIKIKDNSNIFDSLQLTNQKNILETAAQDLEQQNKDAQIASCALIY